MPETNCTWPFQRPLVFDESIGRVNRAKGGSQQCCGATAAATAAAAAAAVGYTSCVPAQLISAALQLQKLSTLT